MVDLHVQPHAVTRHDGEHLVRDDVIAPIRIQPWESTAGPIGPLDGDSPSGRTGSDGPCRDCSRDPSGTRHQIVPLMIRGRRGPMRVTIS
jgi:hypothetical protein